MATFPRPGRRRVVLAEAEDPAGPVLRRLVVSIHKGHRLSGRLFTARARPGRRRVVLAAERGQPDAAGTHRDHCAHRHCNASPCHRAFPRSSGDNQTRNHGETQAPADPKLQKLASWSNRRPANPNLNAVRCLMFLPSRGAAALWRLPSCATSERPPRTSVITRWRMCARPSFGHHAAPVMANVPSIPGKARHHPRGARLVLCPRFGAVSLACRAVLLLDERGKPMGVLARQGR